MISLEEIGLNGKSPAEIVLTTFGPNGEPHASTMGVIASGESKVLLRLFTDTDTFKNLTRSGAAVINVVRDAELLARFALKSLLNFDETALRFENSRSVNAPRLRGADAFVEMEVKNLRKEEISDELGTSEVAHIETEVKYIDVKNSGVKPFKRSESFVIESAVLATKVMEAMKREKEEVAERMFHEIVGYKKKCEHVAQGSKDSQIMAKVVNSLGGRFGWQE